MDSAYCHNSATHSHSSVDSVFFTTKLKRSIFLLRQPRTFKLSLFCHHACIRVPLEPAISLRKSFFFTYRATLFSPPRREKPSNRNKKTSTEKIREALSQCVENGLSLQSKWHVGGNAQFLAAACRSTSLLNFPQELLKFFSYNRKRWPVAWSCVPTPLHQIRQLWVGVLRNLRSKSLSHTQCSL